jgi:hypothetical protein
LAGGDGYADVWKKGFFAWGYKGKRKDLKAAYLQLQGYRDALESPPLLVVSDLERIEVRTNFTGAALLGLTRYIATPAVSKHRLFVWLPTATLADHRLLVVARDDDFTFGVLSSRMHELWSLALGTRLEDRPTYLPTTCFETFPFPRPTHAQREAIATAAAELVRLRDGWLNPLGLDEAELAKRTLTNLYNQRPAWLTNTHANLDVAVFAAYGWPADLPDEEVLARLLALNLEGEPA